MMQLLGVFLTVLASLIPGLLSAQTRQPSTIAELVTYSGKDREQVLYAGAKSEGKVTWYTSLAGDSYKAMIKAFENKYPAVKVESYRTNCGQVTNAMVEETRAAGPIVDEIEPTKQTLVV